MSAVMKVIHINAILKNIIFRLVLDCAIQTDNLISIIITTTY